MSSRDPKSRAERVNTDASLRAVRENTDAELSRSRSARDKEADDILQLARRRADGLLDAARKQADAIRGHEPDEVIAARASDDKALSDERAAADIKLAIERADHERAIATLLASERVETNERLLTERAHADRAVANRDEFLAMVSHDVRGIMGSLAMSADMLLTIPVDGAVECAHREAHRIGRLTAQGNRLIGDLVDFVSVESGNLRVEPAKQDAKKLVAEMTDDFKVASEKRNITITSQVPEGPAVASFDHRRILQVLTNLVGNALKFTQPGGSIALVLERTDEGIRFTVRDTGCGIATSSIETMFEPFSQATRTERRGLGLGLYISRGLVEAHRGTLRAESELGVGSSFYVTLPSGT